MGPFPSFQGNKYILVAVNYVSKWVEAIVSKRKNVIVVLKLFKTIIFPNFGIPRIVISDGGTHVINKVLEKLLRMYGFHHRVATLYHRKTIGQVEVSNRYINEILKTVGRTRKNWSMKLDDAFWVYKTASKHHLGLHHSSFLRVSMSLPSGVRTQGSMGYENDFFLHQACCGKEIDIAE